jgi:hypothetical protein
MPVGSRPWREWPVLAYGSLVWQHRLVVLREILPS